MDERSRWHSEASPQPHDSRVVTRNKTHKPRPSRPSCRGSNVRHRYSHVTCQRAKACAGFRVKSMKTPHINHHTTRVVVRARMHARAVMCLRGSGLRLRDVPTTRARSYECSAQVKLVDMRGRRSCKNLSAPVIAWHGKCTVSV